MSLIPCKNCGEQISDKARKCPHCGYVFQIDKEEIPATKDTENDLSSKIVQPTVNTLVNDEKSKYRTLIIGLGTVICILVAAIVLILSKKNPTTESELSSTFKTSSNNTKISDTYSYDKCILYDSEYATLVLNTITSQGIEINVTSKLEGRDMSAVLHAAALDGKVFAYRSPYYFKIEPGKTETYLMTGTIDSIEHKYLSLCGELFDDAGRGFEKIDICNYELGGNENRETSENERLDYSSDSIDVINKGIGSTGIQFKITNKTSHFIWITCEQLEADDKSYDYTNMYVEQLYIPGDSTGKVTLNLVGYNPDLIVSNIKEYDGSFKVIDYNGYMVDSFEISSSKTSTTNAVEDSLINAAKIDKTILEDSRYSVVLKELKNDGLILELLNKTNDELSLLSVTIAFDGQIVPTTFSDDDKIVPPNESTCIQLKGNIKYLEHQTVSVCGFLQTSDEEHVYLLDTSDVVIGEQANHEFEETEMDFFYDDKNMAAAYVGIVNGKLTFYVKNKRTESANIFPAFYAIDGEILENDGAGMSMPANTEGYFSFSPSSAYDGDLEKASLFSCYLCYIDFESTNGLWTEMKLDETNIKGDK